MDNKLPTDLHVFLRSMKWKTMNFLEWSYMGWVLLASTKFSDYAFRLIQLFSTTKIFSILCSRYMLAALANTMKGLNITFNIL